MKNLNSISSSEGISISKLSDIIQKSNRNIVRSRVVEFIRMYDTHPERLNRLIRSCSR